MLLDFSTLDLSFTVLRHPWERFVSAYNFNKTRLGFRSASYLLRRLAENPYYLATKTDNHFISSMEFIEDSMELYTAENGIERMLKRVNIYLQNTTKCRELPNLGAAKIINKNRILQHAYKLHANLCHENLPLVKSDFAKYEDLFNSVYEKDMLLYKRTLENELTIS
jgi:hypothetical protein